jgi:hypothetical protein
MRRCPCAHRENVQGLGKVDAHARTHKCRKHAHSMDKHNIQGEHADMGAWMEARCGHAAGPVPQVPAHHGPGLDDVEHLPGLPLPDDVVALGKGHNRGHTACRAACREGRGRGWQGRGNRSLRRCASLNHGKHPPGTVLGMASCGRNAPPVGGMVRERACAGLTVHPRVWGCWWRMCRCVRMGVGGARTPPPWPAAHQ